MSPRQWGDLPANAAALATNLHHGLTSGLAHRRVCAMGRRGWLLSRMDARSRTLVDGLDVIYPTSHLAAGLFRLKGWPGFLPVQTTDALAAFFTSPQLTAPLTVFHFGERPGKGQAALEALARRYPMVKPVGSRTVLDELWGPENNQALFKISDARPDVLLVALPSPLQEEWVHAHAQLVPAKIVWGIGRGAL